MLACGCSRHDPNRAAVRGHVRLNNQPIAQGTIIFLPIEGAHGPAAGMEIVGGQYDVPAKDGAALGWNRVEIRSLRKTGRKIQRPDKIERPDSTQYDLIDEEVEAVAASFNSASVLKIEVKPGQNTADFDVASE